MFIDIPVIKIKAQKPFDIKIQVFKIIGHFFFYVRTFRHELESFKSKTLFVI